MRNGRSSSRARIRRLSLLAAVPLAAACASASAYSSFGLGILTCSEYLEKRAQDQQAGTMDNTVFMHSYLSGYLTAGNMMRGLVGDKANDIAINVHAIVQWLDVHCLEHPDQRVAAALEVFWVEASAAKQKLRELGPEGVKRLQDSATP